MLPLGMARIGGLSLLMCVRGVAKTDIRTMSQAPMIHMVQPFPVRVEIMPHWEN